MHGGVRVHRRAASAARAYVEADRSRVDDYYLAEGSGAWPAGSSPRSPPGSSAGVLAEPGLGQELLDPARGVGPTVRRMLDAAEELRRPRPLALSLGSAERPSGGEQRAQLVLGQLIVRSMSSWRASVMWAVYGPSTALARTRGCASGRDSLSRPRTKLGRDVDGERPPGASRWANAISLWICVSAGQRLFLLATPTGLEPAASAVTGRRANQLRYGARLLSRPPAVKRCDSNVPGAAGPNRDTAALPRDLAEGSAWRLPPPRDCLRLSGVGPLWRAQDGTLLRVVDTQAPYSSSVTWSSHVTTSPFSSAS